MSSRMTKFLKQECVVESAVKLENGTTQLNAYGDIQYNAGITVPCRRERYVRDLQVQDGAIVKTSSRYFLDDAVQLNVDDRIDGHVVLSCEEYVDQFGICIGYEAYV